jgi:hypothetical protein
MNDATPLSHFKMTSLAAQAKKANQDRQTAHDKDTLKRHITSKLKTTMIGALASFEEAFGQLWGKGLDDVELTSDQRQYKDIWELIRTEVLNKGNNQLRAAMSEIDQYTVAFNKMEYKFVVTKPGNQGE